MNAPKILKFLIKIFMFLNASDFFTGPDCENWQTNCKFVAGCAEMRWLRLAESDIRMPCTQ